MEPENYRVWTVEKLKQALNSYGIKPKANEKKKELFDRLQAYLGGQPLPTPEELLEKPGARFPGSPKREESLHVRFPTQLEKPRSPVKQEAARPILRSPGRAVSPTRAASPPRLPEPRQAPALVAVPQIKPVPLPLINQTQASIPVARSPSQINRTQKPPAPQVSIPVAKSPPQIKPRPLPLINPVAAPVLPVLKPVAKPVAPMVKLPPKVEVPIPVARSPPRVPTVAQRIEMLAPPVAKPAPAPIPVVVRAPQVAPETVQECLSPDQIRKMSYRELQAELKKRQLNARGDTESLRQRLLEGCRIAEAREARAEIPGAAARPVMGEVVVARSRPRTFTLEECQNLKVPEIKEELKKLGQKTTGNKPELCERLAAASKANLPKEREIHNIVFTEPSTFNGDLTESKPFGVNGRMYNILKQEPRAYAYPQVVNGRKCNGNAYVFGPQLDKSEYRKIGEFIGDSGDIGFVDYDLWSKTKRNLGDLPIWQEEADTPGFREKLRREAPEILFSGNMAYGSGADLYVNYDINGEISSLIIDYNCLFEDNEDAE